MSLPKGSVRPTGWRPPARSWQGCEKLAAALKEVADLDKKYAEIATTEDVATKVAADDVTETEAPAVVQDAGGGGNAVVDQAPAVTVVKVQHAKTNATKNTKKKAKKGGGNRGGSSPGSDSSPGL